MVLHKLHVLEGSPGAISQRHAIAILYVGIGGERKYTAAAAGAKNHSLGSNRLDSPRHQFDGNNTLHPSVVDQQLGDEPLVVSRNGFELQRRLKKRVQHVEAGLVGGKPGAPFLHAAERPYRDVPIRLAIPRTTPSF